jgi:hypothetical protein
MSVAYFGLNSGFFIDQDPEDVRNGTLASASLFSKIANNQTWLATQDVEGHNFLSDTYGISPRTSAGTELTIHVLLAPFSQYVEFWFKAMRDGDDAASLAYEYIEIAGNSEVRRTSAIPAGSNSTGKTHWGSIREARWVVFSGTRDLATPDSGQALKLRAAPSPSWEVVPVTIKVSSDKVKLFTGAYRVMPAIGSLPIYA